MQQAQRSQTQQKDVTEGFTMKPIGVVRSQYPDRRGTPRQPNLVRCSRGRIIFDKKQIQQEHFKELEHFSHIWVVWIFHKNTNLDSKTVSAKIQPPRLHGARVGCLSTRSPHRPNPIGLSVVEVVNVGKDHIDIMSVDMVDGTPVLDVKPYIPYDIVPHDELIEMAAVDEDTGMPLPLSTLRVPAWIYEADVPLRPVQFSEKADVAFTQLHENKKFQHCRDKADAMRLVREVLRQDIRSSKHRDRDERAAKEDGTVVYECKLDVFTVRFRTLETCISVEEVSS